MDYPEKVLKHIIGLQPGSRYDIAALKEPDKFIAAVKQLFTDGSLNHTIVEFNATYTRLKRLDPTIWLNINKNKTNGNNITLRNSRTGTAEKTTTNA